MYYSLLMKFLNSQINSNDIGMNFVLNDISHLLNQSILLRLGELLISFLKNLLHFFVKKTRVNLTCFLADQLLNQLLVYLVDAIGILLSPGAKFLFLKLLDF